jgi:hypothetical protein
VVRRSTVGLAASGGVFFIAGAAGLTGAWSLVVGTLLLVVASLVLAVELEAQDLEPWTTPDRRIAGAEVHQLDHAA